MEVLGFTGKPTLGAIEGQVLNSLPEPPSFRLKTSSELLNRMYELGIWGQRGNFVSIPTDCPQRDERLGWMGDAGVFWRTGSYNFDIDSFSHKFIQDVVDAQTPGGAFTDVSPDLLGNTDDIPVRRVGVTQVCLCRMRRGCSMGIAACLSATGRRWSVGWITFCGPIRII